MEKIFDPTVEKYLKETGVSVTEIKRLKRNVLKEKAVARIKKIVKLIEEEKFDEVRPLLGFSPSGDDMGCDNSFIEFGDILGMEGFDIGELLDELDRLTPKTVKK